MNDRTLVALPIGMAAYAATYLTLTVAGAAVAGGSRSLGPLLWAVAFVSAGAGGAAAAWRAGRGASRRDVTAAALGATAGFTAVVGIAAAAVGGIDGTGLAVAIGGLVVVAAGALAGVAVVERRRAISGS
jgi:hypothetical protein